MKIAICCIAKNEPDIQEWIDYHKSIGFDDVIVVNDYSEMNPINCILINEHPFKDIVDRQQRVYTWILNQYRNEYDWIAFNDCDEFLFPKVPLKELLEKYKDYGGLGVNWVAFGSSGHNERQEGVLRNYTYSIPKDNLYNTHIKTIVNTKYGVGCFWNPHSFSYSENKFCVNENFEIIPDAFNPFTENLIRINHYFTKSKEDWEIKMRRGRSDTKTEMIVTWEHFNNIDSIANIYDNEINEVVL